MPGRIEAENYNTGVVKESAPTTLPRLTAAAPAAMTAMTFGPRAMAARLVGALPNVAFQTLLSLRRRGLIPLAVARALLDGSTVWIGAIASLFGL